MGILMLQILQVKSQKEKVKNSYDQIHLTICLAWDKQKVESLNKCKSEK